eukprot:g5184.t1
MAAEAGLPKDVISRLGDRSYDKRKAAALEIENLVKKLQDSEDHKRIAGLITLLANDFVRSSNPNHRKGGLIGLAATAIGLLDTIDRHLNLLLPPVLRCFEDNDSRVRYYACESMYNIAKVARGNVLQNFNEIFDGLCKLQADVNVDVNNGAQLLDRLVKDIVAESESFDVEKFIPLLRKYIDMVNPYIRQLLIGWIQVLDSVPDIDMLDWLPTFLDGLFNMLSDNNPDIRVAAAETLNEFLREIQNNFTQRETDVVDILVRQCGSPQQLNRSTALEWLHEFIRLGGEKLVPFYAQVLGGVSGCIADSQEDIRAQAVACNGSLLELVKETGSPALAVPSLLDQLMVRLGDAYVPTRVASLQWISMLLDKARTDMLAHVQRLLPALLKALKDSSDDVVLLTLEVLARISLDEAHFGQVLREVVDEFRRDRAILDTRGSLIVRKLCILLEAERVYIAMAGILAAEEDLQFASLIVQTLSLILLTASELADLRALLKQTNFEDVAQQKGDKATAVFKTLYASWCHNPIATLSLCLLAQAYPLASALVGEFSKVEITVGFLMQADKLVQLIESPIFIQLRLQLLEMSDPQYRSLLKSLYGLLMLLPQSAAFFTLKSRLTSASAMHTLTMVEGGAGASPPAGKKGRAGEASKNSSYNQLRDQFVAVQERHAQKGRQDRRQQSLVASGDDEEKRRA